MQTERTATTAAATTPGVSAKAEPIIMRKRIGSIVYEVEIHFNPSAGETLNDKKIRLIRRDMEAAS
jgi:hypothetical protein